MWINVTAVSIAACLIVSAGFWTVYNSEKALNANVESKLRTILKIETEAVRQWIHSEKQFATLLASEPGLQTILAGLDVRGSSETASLSFANFAQTKTRKNMMLLDLSGRLVGVFGQDWLVNAATENHEQFCTSLASGEASVSPVFKIDDSESGDRFGVVVTTPILREDSVLGFLGVGIELGSDLTNVLKSGRVGSTGEVLAISNKGMIISRSRFRSGNHRLGFFERIHRTDISRQHSGLAVMLDGASDQRGESTVFASRWLPDLSLGLVAKMDRVEANAPVNQVRRFVWTLVGLLVVTSVASVVYRYYVFRLRLLARKRELGMQVLGAYELDGKLGEGGMGVVYRAKHALMRRATAVKILPLEKSSREAIERFEREVQLTSQLKHPNTISIYDYGRTENGLFYYAMELLDGLNLEQLVRRESALPDGRVVSILKQVCNSLDEAHDQGLVHRDIKPANIMLCNRGGAVDAVKVLDFGMVRGLSSKDSIANVGLSGTPTYMAPECFKDPAAVDVRMDVFAVGAVGFYLLTGKTLFDVKNIVELFAIHREDISQRCERLLVQLSTEKNRLVDKRLVKLISRCVANCKSDRPPSVRGLRKALDKCTPKNRWNEALAQKWWATLEEFGFDEATPSRHDDNRFALETTQSLMTNTDGSDLVREHRLVQCNA